MRTRRSNGIDADTRITEALDAEARALAQIDQDETGQKLRDLPRPQLPVSYLGPCKDRLY
jgi:hypothetical protein